jgi:hypothetical protein
VYFVVSKYCSEFFLDTVCSLARLLRQFSAYVLERVVPTYGTERPGLSHICLSSDRVVNHSRMTVGAGVNNTYLVRTSCTLTKLWEMQVDARSEHYRNACCLMGHVCPPFRSSVPIMSDPLESFFFCPPSLCFM